MSRVQQKRLEQKISAKVSCEDIVRSIDSLSVLGSGFKLIKFRDREPMLLSVPLELNRDHEDLVSVAQDTGYVTAALMRGHYGWSQDRFDQAIEPLLLEGIVWIDVFQGKSVMVTSIFCLYVVPHTSTPLAIKCDNRGNYVHVSINMEGR